MYKRSLVVFLCIVLLFSSSGFFILPKVQADTQTITETGDATPPVNVEAQTGGAPENPSQGGTEKPDVISSETQTPVNAPIPAPLIVAAETSSNGSIITLSFDRAMQDPGGNEANFCVMADAISDQVALASLDVDTTKINLKLQVPIAGGQMVSLSYTAGSLASHEGGLLASFSDMRVTVPEQLKEPTRKEADSLDDSIPPIEPATVTENKVLRAPPLLGAPSNIHALSTWGDPMLGGGMPGISSGDTIVLPGDAAANVTLTIPAGITALTIQGSNIYTGLNIELAPGHPGLALTIQDLSLTASDNLAGINFGNAAGTNSLTILGSNYIHGGAGCAGVQVPEGCSLTIDGSGSLNATGGSGLGGAGIGGAGGYNGGIITVLGGTITAQGGQGAAGIGGGNGPVRGADVIISGGNITATGGDDGSGDNGGAGIGGGHGTKDYGTVTINGGTIIATGGSRGAGIGAGDGNNSGGIIVINAGNITAAGKDGGAGIGTGYGCGTSTLTINGGIIQSTGSANAAGIGGGDISKAVQITIYDGTINAIGGSGTTIDGDDNGNDITVQSGGAGIGGACKGGTGGLSIYGGTIQAQGGYNSAGIGSGYKANSIDLTISGGSIKASGGENGAGIGSGKKGGGADTVVSGGRIEAIGGPNAQDIGAGVDGSAGSLTVNGWAVIIADDVIAATGSSGPYTIRILNTTGTSAGVQTVTLKTGAGGDCISGATGSDGLFGSLYLKNNTDYQVAVAGYKIHKSGETDFKDATTFNSGTAAATLDFIVANTPTVNELAGVSTGDISNVTTRGATVACNVTSDGGSAVTERGIVYSGLANPTLDNASKAVAATAGTGEFSVNITGLMSGTIAHARAYATNSKGTSYGEDVSFTTATVNGLTVTTGDITDISSKGARVGGYAIPGNLAGIIERGVVYSTNANPTVNDFKVPYTADALEGPILVNLTYLNPNTTYHVRAYAIDSQNIAVYGEDKAFTSAAGTYGWTDLSVNLPANARLDPDLPDNAQGATTMMAMDFIDENNGWLALTRYANNQPVNELLITHDGGATFQVVPAPAEFYSISFKSASEGLAAGNDGRIYRTLDGGLTWRNAGSGVKPYYAVTYPKGSDSGYACGYWMRLSRVKPVDPVTGNETGLETMNREEGISGWSENLNCISFVPSGDGWEGWAGGAEAIIHWNGSEWRADGTYPTSDVLVDDGGGGSHNGICMVDNKEGWCVMDCGFILHTDNNGQEWTIQASPDVFKIGINAYGLHRTLMDVDFLNNQEGWAVGSKGVVLHTVDGGMSWNIEAPGMTNRMMTSVKAISPTCGYALGNDGAFLKYGTSGEAVITAPTVTTGTVSGVSDTSALVAGNVTSDGGSTVTERGVVYCTSADPTIDNGTKVAANTSGLGEFSVDLPGLLPGTDYHVRAFATNNIGTSYGIDKTFTTASAPVGVISVSLNKNETTLNAGQQEQLVATVQPENASNKNVLWTIESQSENGVLTLVDGLITAKKQGTARVRATSAGNPEAYAECMVTINPPALLSISLTPETVNLTTGQTQQMKVTAAYSDQSTVDATGSASYSFSASGIASISSAGLLTANSNGTVVLTATYQEKQDTANITVASSGGGGGGGGGGAPPVNKEKVNTPDTEKVETPLEPEVKGPAAEPSDLAGHWAHDCIMALIANGIIKGYPDGTIRPEQEITRAEAASLLVLSLGLQDYQLQNLQSPYSDQLPAWAERAILICTDKGLMKGYPDGSFKPDQHITRAEMCVALLQAYPQVMQPGFTLTFTDRDSIPEWALAFIELAAANQLVGGYPDGTFQPDAFIKRAEVFTIICHLKGYHRQHSL